MRTRIFLVLAILLVPAVAGAQAWVNDKGALSLTLRNDFQTAQGVWHGSTLVTGLPTQSINSAFAVEYVPLEKLALGLTLNSNAARYTGDLAVSGNPTIILAHGSQDDGSFHWNLTDLDFDAHYQAYDGAIAFTPLLHVRVPLTDYESAGYAASGTHLREAGLGFVLGKYGLGLDDLVFQLGYQFTYVQKFDGGGASTEKFRTNRSDVDLSFSYIFSQKFIAGIGLAYRYTHDGFDLEDYPTLPAGDPLFMFHDPVLKVSYLAPSAVASYQISPAWQLVGRFAAVVTGRNSSNPLSFGLSVGWTGNLAN